MFHLHKPSEFKPSSSDQLHILSLRFAWIIGIVLSARNNHMMSSLVSSFAVTVSFSLLVSVQMNFESSFCELLKHVL
jgi:hypothetical protein